jgi:hypothetical protein
MSSRIKPWRRKDRRHERRKHKRKSDIQYIREAKRDAEFRPLREVLEEQQSPH